jgi:ubiquinone/menaquinone biosynthesis C-methylase UbiE
VPVVSGATAARRFFDRLAPWYDRINARIYKRAWLDRVRREIHGTRVLDVGVGTGFTTRHLDGGIGIDLSREMLRRARYGGHLVQGNFLRPPFRRGCFDSVVFAGSLYYMDDPLEALRVASELLVPGGIVLVLSPATVLLAPFVRILGPDAYERLFRESGLVLGSYERLNWAACLVLGRKA